MCQDLAEGERMVLNSSNWKSSQRSKFFLSEFLCDPRNNACSEFLHRFLFTLMKVGLKKRRSHQGNFI